MIRTTDKGTETEIINIGAAIIHNTQRMRRLNLFVFVQAIFEPPLTDSHFKKKPYLIKNCKTLTVGTALQLCLRNRLTYLDR